VLEAAHFTGCGWGVTWRCAAASVGYWFSTFRG